MTSWGQQYDSARAEKKLQLSDKVFQFQVNEIRAMSLAAVDAEEFVDYLMTITDSQAVEEFFNQCHGEGGRFCGGGTSSRGIKGPNRGPGTHIPAPLNYLKQVIGAQINTLKQRRTSENVRGVTTGAEGLAHAYIGIGSFGTVKIKKLKAANLSKFSKNDLGTVKRQLQSDQRIYNATRTVAPALLLSLIPHTYAVARWKTAQIPGQIQRIDSLLGKQDQKVSASLEDAMEFQAGDDSGMTLEQEVKSVLGQKTSAPPADIKITKAQAGILAEFLLSVENDEDIPEPIRNKIKDELS